ncbi:MAG TPA: periplasmic heavy metal sensor [Methylomirabilota bacterium]|jgi:Spy/CpxP family protein refolding chaperone|nr:periplasmic heavy metal sensor [Methylomirabilota bacterium]
MKRRTMFGLLTAAAVGLVAAGSAVAYGAHAGGRHGMMKRMVMVAIDDALEEAKVTPDQRTEIHAIRDRAFAAVEQARASRRTHLEEGLRLFEADQVDPARVEAFHREGDQERQRMREAIHQAFVDVHGVLTPVQRRAVADYVRAHRLSHMH